MNDRFKFRIWDKQYEKYRNGLAIQDNQVCTYDDKSCVLEQCTGLKDEKGKLIYEGDVLDFYLSNPRNGGHYKGYVFWERNNESIGWMISDLNNEGAWDLQQIAHPNNWMVWGEVIGNIHENHELLEQSNDD